MEQQVEQIMQRLQQRMDEGREEIEAWAEENIYEWEPVLPDYFRPSIRKKLEAGWTPDEVYRHLSLTEEVNPRLDEHEALRRMERVRDEVEVRLADEAAGGMRIPTTRDEAIEMILTGGHGVDMVEVFDSTPKDFFEAFAESEPGIWFYVFDHLGVEYDEPTNGALLALLRKHLEREDLDRVANVAQIGIHFNLGTVSPTR